MGEIIKKVNFDYTKEDGEKSARTILAPKFLKESYNSMKDFDKDAVNYISGYEIDKEGLTEEEIKEYEECVLDYFTIVVPTLEDYLSDLKLDPKRVQRKAFKKEGIDNVSVIKEEVAAQ
jgi:hypothetical protein